MKYSHLIQGIYGAPWAATQSAWYSVHHVFVRHFDGRLKALDLEELIDAPEVARVENGIGIVPVKGTIIKGSGAIEKACGVVSHEDVHASLDFVLSQNPRGILLDIDSPGGTVVGTPELAQRIADINSDVPVVAFTDGLMASAAYYIAAGAREIVASPSAEVGSIGVIWETYNVAESLAKEGIEFNIFTSGPLKGTGHPARKLTDEQKEYMQGTVLALASQFKGFVSTHRLVSPEAMEGQTLLTEQAVDSGLIDTIADRRSLGSFFCQTIP